MNRRLLSSAAYARLAKKLLKRQPEIASSLHAVLGLLADDAFDPQLNTHKLSGKLIGTWSCSAGYDLRIVFEFVQFEGSEAILLQSIGTHDEVY